MSKILCAHITKRSRLAEPGQMPISGTFSEGSGEGHMNRLFIFEHVISLDLLEEREKPPVPQSQLYQVYVGLWLLGPLGFLSAKTMYPHL